MLWNELRGLHFSVGSDPWLLMGDFNAVRRLNERSNPDNFDYTTAASFNSCIADIEIDDLPAKGFWFSWSNRSGGMGLIKSRIDRAMVNHVWQDIFTESEAVFTAPGISDHCPLLVSILPYRHRRKPFKFFNFWMFHPLFSNLVQEAWNQNRGTHPMQRLSYKLNFLKGLLKKLNSTCYNKISDRVAVAKANLVSIQEEAALVSSSDELIVQEREAMLVYRSLSAAEEAFKKQKSRVQWLHLGDNNTKFFHKKMAANRLRNKILSINDGNGIRLEDPAAVKREIVSFYVRLLSTKAPNRIEAGPTLNSIVFTKVPMEYHADLTKFASAEEIKSAMLSIGGDKAPDDLFILCGADQGSFSTVKSALDDFHSFSGLSPNLQKSAVYYSGVSSELKVLLEAILPIPQGHLPVRDSESFSSPCITSHPPCGSCHSSIVHHVVLGGSSFVVVVWICCCGCRMLAVLVSWSPAVVPEIWLQVDSKILGGVW
ncbi:hypothetical protein Vadar_034581 [Vaccinium darrowii]|uniref:Uncharacterized protein n=1 Tax=Vaccinium darrowii TaxID=229202 RepID=A0ACB7XWA4_9ERIC|nr:hypothetical protein Vadar_034581 [Vaccinium darrowii]